MILCKFIDVEFSAITKETFDFKNTITEHPVESGSNIADHVANTPITISLKGIIVGEDASAKYQKLVNYWQNATLGLYIGRGSLSNCVIEMFSKDGEASTGNGFQFSISLKQIRIAKKTEIYINESIIATPQIKKVTSAGIQSKSNASEKLSYTDARVKAGIAQGKAIESLKARKDKTTMLLGVIETLEGNDLKNPILSADARKVYNDYNFKNRYL